MLAVARRPPRNEYLLLDAQPPITTPYTPSDRIARIYRTPMSTLAIWKGYRYVTESADCATIIAPFGTTSAAACPASSVRVVCLIPPHGITAIEMITTIIMIIGATVNRILSTPAGR